MNKLSLLTLALLVALPGCNGKKKSAQSPKKGNVAKHMDAYDNELEDMNEEDMNEEDMEEEEGTDEPSE